MDTVFEIFAAIKTAMDIGVMTQDLMSSVVLSIAAFIAAQWAAGQVSDTELRRASREMMDIAERWRWVRAQSIEAASVASAGVVQRHERPRVRASAMAFG